MPSINAVNSDKRHDLWLIDGIVVITTKDSKTSRFKSMQRAIKLAKGA